MLGSLQIQDLTRSAEHRQLLLAVIWDQVQTTLTCIYQLGTINCYMAMDLNGFEYAKLVISTLHLDIKLSAR